MSNIILNGVKYCGQVGNTFTPECYSTEERLIGCWTDGRPLYQITVSLENYQCSSGLQEIPISLDSSATIVANDSFGRIDDGAGGYITEFFGQTYIIAGASYNKIYVVFSRSTTFVSFNITLKFIKMNDTPGSGAWTPTALPTVHYSTGEQVIGTWIDGSTLYETTYTIPQTGSGYQVFDFTGLNVSDVTNLYPHEGIAFAPSSSASPHASVLLDSYSQYDPHEYGFIGFVTTNSTGVYQLHYRIGSTLIGGTAIITVRYTKTTN